MLATFVDVIDARKENGDTLFPAGAWRINRDSSSTRLDLELGLD
jgi:hypothetical protein